MVSCSTDRCTKCKLHIIDTYEPCGNDLCIGTTGTVGTDGKLASPLVNHWNMTVNCISLALTAECKWFVDWYQCEDLEVLAKLVFTAINRFILLLKMLQLV